MKKKLFISIKHDLIICREMPETTSQKSLLFFHKLDSYCPTRQKKTPTTMNTSAPLMNLKSVNT